MISGVKGRREIHLVEGFPMNLPCIGGAQGAYVGHVVGLVCWLVAAERGVNGLFTVSSYAAYGAAVV